MVTCMKTNMPPGPNESNAYNDEVLNAGWLPTVLIALGLNTPAAPCLRNSPVDDPESFLQRIYRVQE